MKAIARFDYFKRKASKNNTQTCFVLKADIRHYFDTVDHKTLIQILNRKIKDKRVIWLIRVILENHKTKVLGKGMPLGNLTSQFFANVYLNELDIFVKKVLKAKFYVRYVDDFVILNADESELLECKRRINEFLKKIMLDIHPEKSKIFKLERGICFLGIRNYYYHKLLKKSNLRKINKKILKTKAKIFTGKSDYCKAYDLLEGWLAYSKTANTFKLRNNMAIYFESLFPGKISDKEINRWLKVK